jgi:ABC-2 type transport system permease protein
MAAIAGLTLRQLAGSRRLLAVLALALLPPLAALVYRLVDTEEGPARFADDVTTSLVAGASLPLATLLLATSALGDERGDRTLGYLVLKPVARWRIVVPKLAAALLVGAVPTTLGAAACILIIDPGDVAGALATGGGVLAGSVAYSALFLWLGLATRHAIVVGLVYVVAWEDILATYLDGIRYLSIRRFTLAVVRGLDADRLRFDDPRLGLAAGLLGVAVATVVFTALTVRRLRRMDIP